MHESEKGKWSCSVVSDSSDPMDCSLPGSSIHGIFQARVLEWGAIVFSSVGWGCTEFTAASRPGPSQWAALVRALEPYKTQRPACSLGSPLTRWPKARWAGRPQGEGWDPLLTSLSTWWPPLRRLLAESLTDESSLTASHLWTWPPRHRPGLSRTTEDPAVTVLLMVWGNGAQQQPVLSAALGRAVLQSLYYTRDFFLLQY